MTDAHRLAFLVVEAEPTQGLSTCKLLLESAKHNVVTAYSPQGHGPPDCSSFWTR